MGSAAANESSSSIADRISQDQLNLNTTRDQIADLDKRIATSRQYLDQKRLQLADATSSLRDAESRYSGTLGLYESRISAIYKLGDENFYGVVVESENFSDAVSRISFLSKVTENDQKLVEQVKADAEYLRQMRETVDDLKRAQADDVESLKLRRQQLEAQASSDQARIDSQLAEMAQATAREQEQEAMRQTETEASIGGGDFFTGVMGPSVIVSNQPPPGLRATGRTITGMASWYGPGFQGNHTANGEIYNMYAFTAAHKSLPFNTWLKVTHNGRSVFVRINDRGPYVGGRIIDLSLASAQAIGISGVGFVSAEIYN